MERCDGEIRPELSNGGDGGGSEDRISALPDDVLINILIFLLDAAAAARTSVLSSRWRRLWTLLPQLWFSTSTDPHGIRAALESHEAPALDLFDVSLMDATPESVEVWLQIAAHRLSGDLQLINEVQQNEEEEDEAPVELPCFENATSICLELGSLGLAVPPLGVFSGLTDLYLACIKLRGPWMLGDAVSTPRCPSLQMLTVDDAWGVSNFIIHSESLVRLKLLNLHGLQQLTVMTPALELLSVAFCFGNNQPVASISAPRLVLLDWQDFCDPRFTQFDKMENLAMLRASPFLVYGRDEFAPKLNNSFLGLLGHCVLIQRLKFVLLYLLNITNMQYLMEDIRRLPDITHLDLDIMAKGHSFGASVFHVLRMCTGVRKLVLTIEVQPGCPSGCVCDHPSNWKTEEVVLNRLRKVKIHELGGTEHEAALIKRLFDWAIVLEKMTITFHHSVAESKAKEFFQVLQRFSRPEICMEGPPFA